MATIRRLNEKFRELTGAHSGYWAALAVTLLALGMWL